MRAAGEADFAAVTELSANSSAGPPNTPLSLSAFQSGNLIHFVKTLSGGSYVTVIYDSFDMNSNRWLGTSDTAIGNLVTNGQTGGLVGRAQIVVRTTGEAVVLFNNTETATMGTNYARVAHRRRTSVGTWAAAVQVDANTAYDFIVMDAVLGATGNIHFFFFNKTLGQGQSRTLSAANALSTTVDSASNGTTTLDYHAVPYVDGANTRVAYTYGTPTAGSAYVSRFISSSAPTYTINNTTIAANTTGPSRVAADGIDLWSFFRTNLATNISVSKSTDHGATWGTPTISLTGLSVSALREVLSRGVSIFKRGSAYILPYVVNSNGTLKYNEYVVRWDAKADAWNVGDKSANFTLTNDDKTATVATATAGGVHSTTSVLTGSAGKFYAEFLNNSNLATSVGIQAASADEASTFPSGYMVGLTSGGMSMDNGSSAGNLGSAIASGDTLCVAFDTSSKKLWYRKNGELWNNIVGDDPATGTGGIQTTFAAVQVCLRMSSGAAGASVTVRTEGAEFTQAAPAGFKSWMNEVIPVADAWNVNDKVVNTTLSNGDKTVTGTATGLGGVRSTRSYRLAVDTGKYYAELRVDAGVAYEFGLLDITLPFDTTQRATYSPYTGHVYINNVDVVDVGKAVVGDIVSIAWDPFQERVWFRVNNGNWNGSAASTPTSPSTGLSLSSLPQPNYHALASCTMGTGETATIRTRKAEFTQITPTGYTSWMGEVLTPPSAMPAGPATMSGAGTVSSVGTGNLTSTATAQGFGFTQSSGTGALTSVGYARTNYVKYSQDFEQSSLWVQADVTITTNAALDPNWELTAERIGETAAAVAHYVYQSVSIPEGGVYTLSAYVKVENGQWFKLMGTSGAAVSANFDVLNGQLGLALNCTSSITPAGAGWYRISITALAGSPFLAGAVTFYLFPMDADQSATTHPGAGRTYFIWGAQLERGTVATPYIRTPDNFAVSISETIIGSGEVSWVATGVLAPAERTNLFSRSEEFEPSWWLITGGTVTYNDIAAPNATMSADKFTDSATYEHHYVMQSVAFAGGASGKQFTFSMYAKAGTVSWLQFYAPDNWVNFNLSTGVIGQKSAGATATITPVGNGWYRCSITYTSGEASPSAYALLKDGDVAGVMSWLATGTGTMYFWGAQLELGEVATAYIPTFNNPVSVASGATLSAVGLVTTPPAIGVGALAPLAAAISSFGNVRSTGTGALTPTIVRRTNNAMWSQELNRWSGTGVTVATDAVTSPVGTPTAETMTSNVAGGQHRIYNPSPYGNMEIATYTASFFLKAGTCTWAQISSDAVWANFNLATGALGLKAAGVTSAIVDVGNGWWRCSLTWAKPDVTDAGFTVWQATSDFNGLGPTHATVGLTLHVVGAQFELGPVATPYIPTLGGTAYVQTQLSGYGVSEVSLPPIALTGGVASVAGVGLSESRSTSAALNSQSNFLQLGTGQSSSTGTGTLTEPAHAVFAPGTASWNASGILPSVAATLVGAGAARWSGAGILPRTGTTFSTAIGVGAAAWTISGGMPADIATLAGVAVSGSVGTGVLTSGPAVIEALGSAVTGVGGTGALTSFATMTGAGISRSYATVGAVLASQPVTFVAPGVSSSAGSGILPRSGIPLSALAGVAVSGSVGPAPLAAEGVIVEGAGLVRFVANGALATGTASIVSVGTASWRATGALASSAATAASVGTSRSFGTAPLLASVAYISAFEGVTIISGTGTPQSQSSTMVAPGVSRSTGDGDLPILTPAILTGVAVSQSRGTSVLTPSVAALVGTGTTFGAGTGSLTAQAAAVVSAGVIIAAPSGTGTPASQPATVAGTGIRSWAITGALAAQAATAVGLARQGWAATGTLPAQAAALVGVGTASWSGTGTTPSQAATVVAAGVSRSVETSANLLSAKSWVTGEEGVTVVTGTGTLPAQSRVMVGAGFSRSFGIGTMPVLDRADIAAVGISESRGTSVLQDAASALESEGTSRSIGSGLLPTGPVTLSGVGVSGYVGTAILPAGASTMLGVGVVESQGTGTLTQERPTMLAAGLSQSFGPAILMSSPVVVQGEANATTTGFGNLVSAVSKITSVGSLQSRGHGDLVALDAVLDGDAVSRSFGIGKLPAQRSRVAGFASITAFGSADLEPNPAVITGHNLIYGEGVLVAEYAAGDGMTGTGDISEYTAPPPTGLPGSYPGTSTWYQTGYVPPPWWLGEAA
jgi:hypothetical protein